MKSTEAGKLYTATLDLIEGGEYLVADANSVNWTLRGNDGVVLTSSVAVNPTAVQTITIAIPSANNIKTKTFEYRTLQIEYKVDGVPHQLKHSYRLTDYLPYIVTNDDVRNYIGVGPDELSDDAIDLDAAYLRIAEDLTSATLNTALSSGTSLSQKANNAILGEAVDTLIPSLMLRVKQRVRSDTAEAARILNLDFEGLRRAAKFLVVDFVEEALQASQASLPFIVTSGTDPFTGA